MTEETLLPSKAERQKKYREGMKAQGFVCKQLWIPKDKVPEVEELVLKMREELPSSGEDEYDDDELI